MRYFWFVRTCLLTILFTAPLSAVVLWAADKPSQPMFTLPSADPLETATLIYVSDYFSFVGKDDQGRVALALDNNRGRDGSKYQAEHFVVLHDERSGWMKVAGNGPYDNTAKDIRTIPNSAFFQFEGTPERGILIKSPANNLQLQVGAVPIRTRHEHQGAKVWMGSASAVLTWHGRTIPGRVIYEHIMMPNFNRLTRTYWGVWKQFQGLYVSAGGTNDVYLHSQQSEKLAPLIGSITGFSVFNDVPELLNNLHVEAVDQELGPGFYKRPTQWRVSWQGSNGPASMVVTLSYQNTIKNWIIGGFSMGIVTGELSYGGQTWPVYGLAEVIM